VVLIHLLPVVKFSLKITWSFKYIRHTELPYPCVVRTILLRARS
jgi:hypothetical protein